MNDQILADLAGGASTSPPPRPERDARPDAVADLPPRSATHEALWDRDTPAHEAAHETPHTDPLAALRGLVASARDESPEPASMPGRHEADSGPGRMVRPYAITGGRTRSKGADIPLEALITATPLGRARATTLIAERRAIATLCVQPMSVAEVSAHLKVPLGVARVLVGDMTEEGLVEVNGPGGGSGGGAPDDLKLLERVLNGLRAL